MTAKVVGMLKILILQFLVAFAQGQGPGGNEEVPRSRSVDMRVTFEIKEGQPSGTFVGKIPTRPNFTYRFNDKHRYFILNGTSGLIETLVELDRESLESDRFDLVILSSQPTYPIEVRVNVLDVNDNSPVFPEASISVAFSESANAGTRIILDTATDGDTGTNDVTTEYKIVSGNDDGKFSLVVTTNPSGETPYLHLETTGKLDRESNQNYQLNISAQDGGEFPQYGYLLVNITILDVNDNPPIFDHSDYTVSLNESAPPGTKVLSVRATDIDEGDNSRITYYLDEAETQFTVDADTGVVSTFELLNCQKNCHSLTDCPKSCVFTVFARDHGSPRQDGRTYVTVNLLDANDHDPIIRFRYFPATADFATVDENAQNGSVVAAVSVIDFDEGQNGDTTVQIKGGNENNHFRLDSNPSFDIVRVNGVLDREKLSKYNLTIQATDKGTPSRSSTTFLIIHVNDINDHEPVFEKSEYTSVLSELVPVGTYVAGITATDEDTGVNSNVYYAVVSGNEHQWFDIDAVSGLVTTRKHLDREIAETLELKISARDGGPNPKWAYTVLRITVLDENDETPHFAKNVVNVTVAENSPSGTLVAMIRAVDNDQGNNGSIVYSFAKELELEFTGLFSIDSMYGRLTTRSQLDREKRSFYEITVVASDQGHPPLSSTVTINLFLEDVNDNVPEFYPLNYFVAVSEDAQIGLSVVKVLATDPDEIDRDHIKYEIIKGDDGKFSIDEKTGVVKTYSTLDRNRKSQYQLFVTAYDSQNKQAKQAAEITIFVEDQKMKPITFKEHDGYSFSIEEDGEVTGSMRRQVGRIVVSDNDAVNGLKYAIVSGDRRGSFQIIPTSGIITTTERLDREAKSMYNLVIVAYTGQRYGRTNATIHILDVNDNAPKFKKSHATVDILENWPVGHEVYMTSAVDQDSGVNSQLTYSLKRNPEKIFVINKTTGMIYIDEPLQSKSNQVYDLEVTAVDSGTPSLSGLQYLTVSVLDVNDHTPVFGHTSYETVLLESASINTRFFGLLATDADQGRNSFVTYDITDGNDDGKFGVFPDGYLYVRRSLDREERDYYSVNVVARDDGSPPRSSSVSVIIHIMDENDNVPQFTNSTFTFNVIENEPPDSYVGKLSAEDADRGHNAELTFSISTNQNDFVIDPKSGFIKTIRYFDREKLIETSGQDYIVMEAVVVDGGSTRLRNETKVTVYITDVNDNHPVFSRAPYNAVISEGAPLKTQVIRVSATDKDEGLNGDIVYSIVDGNDEGHFEIDPANGQITLKKILDRETTDRYVLTVMAKDAGEPLSLSSKTSVTIDISDENDNRPKVLPHRPEVKVPENADVGFEVMRFSAVDADLGTNKQVSYGVSGGNVHETFRMDSQHGVLYLNNELDREEIRIYHLNVTATDSGSPRLSSTVPFNVYVLDVNDNAPRFANKAIVRQIQEGIPINSAIVTVTANDADVNENGKISFSIGKQEPEGDHFGIHPNTGVIFTKKDIDREFSDTFKLIVVGTDRARNQSMRLSSEKAVTIIIEDVNDNAPQFVSVDAGILRVGAIRGSSVMSVLAEDKDTNSNGLVRYNLLPSEHGDLFSIDGKTGEIRLLKGIDRPSALYHLVVRATDQAVPSKRKFTQTTVTIIAESNSEVGNPVFSENEYSTSVPENKPIGTFITTVSARYQSGDGDGDVEYYISSILSEKDGSAQLRKFRIDHKSGTITTAEVLDRESGVEIYWVVLQAVDVSSSSPRTSSAKVKVVVEDENDTPPVFDTNPYQLTISEDRLPGYKVISLTATDADLTGKVSYSLINGDFGIDTNDGHLTVKKALDRETTPVYALVVRASDGVQSSNVIVRVEVTDTNDNPPTFLEPVYSFDIVEDTQRGAKVGSVQAIDSDQGQNAQISYSVLSDWGNDVFSVNPQTGVFTLTSRLDYEQVQHYIFVVQAEDSGTPSLSSTVTVYFNILDLNDNAPLFDPMSYSDEVFENVTIGTSILTISATDQDSGHNGHITYSIIEGDDEQQFWIDANGTIFTRKLLDRETQSFYNLIIMASDQAEKSKRLSSTVQVTIILKDVNDMAPEFVTPNSTSVLENVPINTVVMAIKAVDRDEGRNSYIEYSLDSPFDSRFSVGPVDGLLRVSKVLDREKTANYTLKVSARDRGHPSKTASISLLINVADENDNSPVFDSKQYSASVAENASIGVSVLQVSASDEDDGTNGHVRYFIVGADKNHDFTIGEDTGIIRVNKKLDYERQSRYVMSVQAEDNPGSGQDVRYDTATVTISVTDLNDNPPIFVDSPYFVYVIENMVNVPAVVTTVAAYDADDNRVRNERSNGDIRYLIKDGDKNLFKINETTGQIIVQRALDRERQSMYSLVVVAMDKGTPRLTGTGTINIVVNDVNDHAPEFEKKEYVTTVNENLPPNSHVITIKAHDADEGLNSKITYRLLDHDSSRFAVDAETAEIRSKVTLDREDTDRYVMVLEASDSSLTNAHTAYTNITVVIGDDNDNAPKFQSESTDVYIPDPSATGQFVFGAHADDADTAENGKLVYHLSGPDADKFQIDQDSGVVKTAQRLNGRSKVYHLQVRATDSGKVPKDATAEIIVRFRDKNLFPVFTPSARTFKFREDVRNTVVTKVTARSPKSKSSDKMTYHIAGGDYGGTFQVEPNSGSVKIQNGLDYEMYKEYKLWIEARDDGQPPLSSILRLNLEIEDTNDNAPVFENSIYNVSILEEQFAPQDVIVVRATDVDTGSNGKVLYRLQSETNKGKVFSLDEKSGKIFTNVKLDREKFSSYSLTVEAIDRGIPALTGSATVVVFVTDKNDNPPRFTRLFSVNVTEDAEVGTFVIQVTSSDKDVGSNANAVYSFTENPGEKFRIDPVSGNVTVAGPIDREVKDEYVLKVSAVDGSWRAETPLTISVQDVNDNAPKFGRSRYAFSIPELQRSVAFVGHVIASDRDKHGPNSVISYSLKRPSDLFRIDPSSGEILSKSVLKYKKTAYHPSPENQYHLVVMATDHGKPPLSSEVSVVVNIVDVNNNAPEFKPVNYFSPVLESSSYGQSVMQMVARDDKDVGVNAEIEYSINGGNGTSLFTIDKKTGWIVVATPLLGRKHRHYVLMVRARDKGIPPQESEVMATLVVTGPNKHRPTFTALSYQVIVPESEAVNSEIIAVKATDSDEGLNAQVIYEISSGNEDGYFSVNPTTGSVTISHPLDYDNIRIYHLNITATDMGFIGKNATAMLTVILTDVNDNPPKFSEKVYDAYVAENSASRTSVFQLETTDIDSSAHAETQYSIVGGSGKDFFGLRGKTGIVYSKKSFDYESKSLYALDVLASNPGSNQFSSTTVRVHITGKNEFYPQFVQPVFQFTVSESAVIGTTVGTLKATDQDRGNDGNIYYLLVGSSNKKGFAVDQKSGVITVSQHLDREAQSQVVLTVMAKNEGSIRGNDTDQAQVVVMVQDGNDPPIFDKPSYETHIQEDAAVGTKVITVTAIDKDVRPKNHHFSYSIIAGNVDHAFKVDPQSGLLETTSSLDRETVAVYNLTVGAIDSGIPPQTGTTLVRVYINDVNDNGPEFDPPNVVGYISENEPAGTSVMTLSAVDPDLPPNGGPFTYHLIGGPHKSFFQVDKNSGLVKTRKSIDREKISEMKFVVELSDNGQPTMKSQSSVSVVILDTNDSPSHPRSVAVLVYAFNNVFRGGLIANVKPLDPDSTGQYRCKIVSGGRNIFTIPSKCDLHAKVLNHPPLSTTMTINGNDGKHRSVTSTVGVSFVSFTNATLEHSITIYMANQTAERFIVSQYEQFLLMLKNIFKGDYRVMVYSMSNDKSNMVIMMVVRSSTGDYYRKDEIARILRNKQSMLDGALNHREYVIDYNPCENQPCQNGGKCKDTIRVYERQTEVLDSPNFIFTSPKLRHEFKCNCPEGFIGKKCERRKDPCSENPCLHGATCANNPNYKRGYKCICKLSYYGDRCEKRKANMCADKPCQNGGSCQEGRDGSFFCLCRLGFRGNRCELTSGGCRPNPCLNGAVCIDTKPVYKCSCKDNFYGKHCEKSSWGFHELSYMSFLSLDATTNDISIIFSTVKMTALLAYSYGPETGGRSDFLALELISGKPKFSFGGTRTAIASIKSDRLVSDGKWHKVTVIRNGHVASMSVVSCTDNGEKCERCHPGDTSCYSTASGSTGTLNFEKELLYVGGIPSFSPLLERPGQLSSNDFIGCVQLIRVNGRQLDLSAPLSTKHTSNTCPRRKDICNIPEVCGSDGKCVDNWFTKSCICRSGLIAPNCDKALAAVTFGDGTFVTFEGKEKFRRRQLLDPTNRKRRSVSRVNSMNINFRMRTSNGIILYSATNKDYSALFVRDGKINYVSQIREEPSVKITIGDVNVNDAEWHTVTLEDDGSGFIVKLDSDHRSDKIDNFLLHPFLDPYLTSLHVGGSLHKIFDDNDIIEGFDGCMSTFTINDEVQPFNGSGSMFDGVPQGKVLDGCKSMVLTQEAPGTDPLNIGVILVIVFFVFLMIAILISFLVFRRRKQQQREKSHGHIKQNGNLIRSAASPGENSRNHPDSEFAENCDGNDEILRHHLHQQDVASKKYKEREVAERPQRPDIIEREVLNKSPPMPSMRNVNDMNQIDNNRNMSVHVADCEAPEHYDLENASSIAPSDIDIVYHYKGFRDGNIRKYKTNPHVPTYHKHNHRNNSPHQFGARDSPRSMLHRQSPNTVVPRQSPSVLKMQSTPLARLSPSSELSQQTPRILTLQDISGKPLQTALLATSQGVGGKDPLMNSERSLISPVSHLSHSTGSILANSQGNAKKKKMENSVPIGLTADEIERLNTRPRNSSLVSTLDAVSSSSDEDRRGNDKLAELLETNTELLEPPDSSTDESGNDSFTCSEFEYENNYDKVTREFGPGNMIFSKLAEAENEDFDDSFHGSLSTLVASDDDVSHMSSYKPPNGSNIRWDYILNWGPNFESLVGVFKDIAQLPDTTDNNNGKPDEEYV